MSRGILPILFGTIVAAFNREAVQAGSPGFQSRESVNKGLAKPQRGESVIRVAPSELCPRSVFLATTG
jgi:hypothetical protein